MFGDNYFGQLGTGDNNNKLKPVKTIENVKSVNCAGFHTAVIKRNW